MNLVSKLTFIAVLCAVGMYASLMLTVSAHEQAHYQNCVYNTNSKNISSNLDFWTMGGETRCSNSTKQSLIIDAQNEVIGYHVEALIGSAWLLLAVLLSGLLVIFGGKNGQETKHEL